MSGKDYTPTTAEIRAEWISAQDWAGMNPDAYYGPIFERWLREDRAKTFEDWYGEEIESHMRQYGWEFMTDGGSRGQA